MTLYSAECPNCPYKEVLKVPFLSYRKQVLAAAQEAREDFMDHMKECSEQILSSLVFFTHTEARFGGLSATLRRGNL